MIILLGELFGRPRKPRWESPTLRECAHRDGLVLSWGTITEVATGEQASHADRFWSCLGCGMPMNPETKKPMPFVSSRDQTREGKLWERLR